MRRPRRLLVASVAFGLVGIGLVGAPKLEWRAQLLAMKASGQLVDMPWPDVLAALRPNGPYPVGALLRTGNPYRAVRNRHTTPPDVAEGERLFRVHCAGCHGFDGTGGAGRDLTAGDFRRGASDLAVYRTLKRGVPGTPMPGFDLPDRSLWQLVGYVGSLRGKHEAPPTPLSREAGPPDATAGLAARGDGSGGARLQPEVTLERLVAAAAEPENWLTYSGTYDGHRHSALDDIDRDNVDGLRLRWLYQLPTIEREVETTPLVVDGVLYATEPPSGAVAIDAATGRLIWRYERPLPERLSVCCGHVNRGAAILGDRLFMGTLDAHLVALDARSGEVVWDVEVADGFRGHSITGAPLAVGDLIVVGVSGGMHGIRGFLDAYDAYTGERRWRFYTVPAPGEAGHETWGGDSWRRGGAATWVTGSYDPALELLYWGTGNPSPPWNGGERPGDNLYANSVVALEAASGRLVWHFQFTPHDEHDWDATQVPVLVDAELDGLSRKLMLWPNRNAFYYVLDRATGEFLLAREFARQTWADGIDASGRPIVRPEARPSPEGTLVYPAAPGATNWWSRSYSAGTGLLYVPTIVESAHLYFSGPAEHRPGSLFLGGAIKQPEEIRPRAALRALVATSGEVAWEAELPKESWDVHGHDLGGVLSTAGGLVFAGAGRTFLAWNARTGEELWRWDVGGPILAAPVTYRAGGVQHVVLAAGRAILAFALDERT